MMHARNDYELTLWLAQKPGFCCGCWCLAPVDARRTKRVLRLVRAVMKSFEDERRAASGDMQA